MDPDSLDIQYERDYTKAFKMVYPEPFEMIVERYLQFFKTIEIDQRLEQDQVILMVSHGNAFQSFLCLVDEKGHNKMTVGIGYCCMSIARRSLKSDGSSLI